MYMQNRKRKKETIVVSCKNNSNSNSKKSINIEKLIDQSINPHVHDPLIRLLHPLQTNPLQ